jgi:hypothetical protein
LAPSPIAFANAAADLAAIKADLEFLIERGERFRKEQALKPLYTMVGSAAIVDPSTISLKLVVCPSERKSLLASWPFPQRSVPQFPLGLVVV